MMILNAKNKWVDRAVAAEKRLEIFYKMVPHIFMLWGTSEIDCPKHDAEIECEICICDTITNDRDSAIEQICAIAPQLEKEFA